MGYIKQLSDDLIKKIAAGEVIERPASVVKELVENSIDAGATKISIEIARSGKYIKVSDNGMGIASDDIPLLFSKHATSKIKRFDDLWSVNSLGFRGEALASISAVSKITCTSKHINEEYGFEIKLTDGKLDKKNSSIAIGTIFEIDDLFFNVPARQKFLKSETTEIGHIYDVIIHLAIAHPKISFTLLNNKNTVLKSNGSKVLEHAICELLGTDLQDKLISIATKNSFLELNGFISTLEAFRTDRKSIFVFINNRPVKCHIISKAISSAFEGLLPAGKFPVVALSLKFKPNFVDINVHPTKKEVRYTQPNDVYNLVFKAIQESISNYYKDKYEEKSQYSLPKPETIDLSSELKIENQSSSTLTPSYSQAAFDLYSKSDIRQIKEKSIQQLEINAFSVSYLKCSLVYSEKPIANMTKVGNKTIFEVGTVFSDNVQVVFSGEVSGDEKYKKDFFNSLSEMSKNIYKSYLECDLIIQKQLIAPSLDEELEKEPKRKKPPEKILYEVWERDDWTCVYCAKQLLDPKTVKTAMKEATDAFVSYLNDKGEKITNHILREYAASYDHYLPVSKLPQFNFEPESLFACCFECNRKKLDSMDLKSWMPNRTNSWDKVLEIAGLCFTSSKIFKESLTVH